MSERLRTFQARLPAHGPLDVARQVLLFLATWALGWSLRRCDAHAAPAAI